nr:uncharacterized protein LOC112770094 [Arachis hypogaea]
MDVDTGDTDEIYSCDDIEGLLDERFRNVADVEGEKEGMNEDAKKFYNLVDEASKELYPGCKGFSTLSFTIRLYLLKCLHGWSNASFTSLLELLKKAIPNLNLPSSFNKAKAMVRDLGLDYKKIDACPNDCMLYWKEHENKTCCHECGTSHWIEPAVVEGDISLKKAHNIPAKTLRHFPLIPRLQRLFMCSKTAKNMSWHQEERKKDGKLKHPADGQSWKDFDNRHSKFAKEPRNLRLGLASDGFNPFRTMSISHSTWPVILMTYNLPPWMCMKQEYFMLSLLILGPKSLGNDIDVYLQPLIEELKELWELGVETYDAARNKTFQMHAALLWTISDFPAYAMLSGWSTKGKLACPSCNYGTCSSYLTHSRKMCYMGHRIFLPEEHPWRTNKRSFNGKEEHRKAPPLLEGMEVLSHLDSMENSFGKTKKKVNEGPWRKMSIFFDLPYWKYNTSRHNLDVMHIEKNIVDSILGTLLDISGKTKDHLNARYDLKEIGIRKNLHPKEIRGNRKVKFAKACFSMTKAEKSIFCDVLKKAKLPDGAASNISRCVNLAERKVSGYKTHDAHFMLHYLLQIPIKSILPDSVAIPLIRLGSFFRQLCQKVITLEEINQLEAEIVITLCQLERIIPPSFFDIMMHLPIHLANEVRLGGPVQFRWMYPPERYMCTLKSYVRNRSSPEGSIAEAYLVDECLTFCSRYLHDGVQTKLNRIPRNNDANDFEAEIPHSFPILFPKKGCPLEAKKGEIFSLDDKSRNQAHSYILLNCGKIEDYVREHEADQQGTSWVKAKNHSMNFPSWFKARAMRQNVPDWIKELSRGPNKIAKRYSGYFINGYRFHTRQREARRKTQNSGVTLVALTTSFASAKDPNPIRAKVSYYGRINDIIELDYFGNFKVVLFRCDWYETQEDGYGSSYVQFNKKCYQEEPFVLACQVHQCFYVQDPFDQNKHYVMKSIPRDLFSIGDEADVDPQAIYEKEPSDHSMGPSIPNDNGEIDLIRGDLHEVVIDASKGVLLSQEYNTKSEDNSEDDIE